jgi:hypothetical protein
MIDGVFGYNDEPIENYAKKHIYGTAGARLFPGLMVSGGINYNHEAGDKGVDLFGNAFISLNEANTFHLEYIMGANDEDKNRINLGYKLQSGSLGIQFDLKNLFSGDVGRQIQILYRESF